MSDHRRSPVTAASMLAILALLVCSAPLARADPSTAVATVQALGAAESGTTVYAASSGELYRAMGSTLADWDPRAAATATMRALSPDPAHPDTVLIAATQSSPYVSAVYRSDDGGRTMTATPGAPGVTAFGRPAHASATVFAGASDQSTGYIYRSSDGGLSWTTVYSVPSYSPGAAAVTALAVDPTNDAHVLAAVSTYHGGGVVESGDGGASWHALPDPPRTALMAPTALAIAPSHPGEIWAGWGLMGHGLLARSTDGGQHWTALTAGLPASPFVTTIAHDTLSGRAYVDVLGQGVPHRIYAAGPGGVFEQFAPTATEIGLTMVLLSTSGLIVTGDESHHPWVHTLIGPLHWGVAAPFVHYYASVNAGRLLGRPISPLGTCGAATCQYFEKARLEAAGSGPSAAPALGAVTGDLLTARAPLPVGGTASTVTYAGLATLAQPGARVAPPARFRSGVATVKGGTFVPFSPSLGWASGQVVPAYFWRYMSDRHLTPGGWLHDLGLPLTRAVAATVTKGSAGTRHIVLQAFQKAALTYDPANPVAWRVERANIGVDAATSFPRRVR